MKKLILSVAMMSAVLAGSQAYAQEQEHKDSEKGYVTGSFESNSNYYVKDSKTGAEYPDDHFGSNNYLKLDYYRGKFSAGIQAEGYLPAIVGHPENLNKVRPTNFYASWTDDSFSITAGSFYDQFGSGLLLRAWEDRALGINNALLGARFTYNYQNYIRFKAIWGQPRFGMGYTSTQVRGADLALSLSDMFRWDSALLSLEGSALSKYEKFAEGESLELQEAGIKPATNGYSLRVNAEVAGFFLKGEYVGSGKKHFTNPYYATGESSKRYLKKDGNAQLIELGYNGYGLGVNASFRRLEWMESKIQSGSNLTSNLMNYVPGMCAQYTYLLSNLHPYSPEIGRIIPGASNFINSGEIGGQIDVFYNFRKRSALGGKRGLKIHGNFSTYYTIAEEGTVKGGSLLYRNFNVDVEKRFTGKFKGQFLYSLQEYNPTYGMDDEMLVSNIFVADLLYKWSDDLSTRLELQYLASKDDSKDWMAALLEVNFAPKWSAWGSDMYNHGDSKTHYYNVGLSYTKSRTRVSLGYGRYRQGFLCSGGVCRVMPAYTGANFSVLTSF